MTAAAQNQPVHRLVTVKLETHTKTEVRFDVAQLAELFASMNDEEQAQFFIEVARIAATWPGCGPQWFMVGRHLRTCSCSTEEARDLVRDLALGVGAEP